ncbi:MAG TPA: 3-oxoadipate enol-lactonase [Casimicrobiaceae bacterium]|nr:3-oxoadipate enol-lactonase [Casimicrobiaceae bacterium]
MPFVIRDGARLYWRSDGDPASPPLLLGCSLGTEHALWAPAMSALTRRFRVLSFDWRGHGASEAPAGEYTIADLAGDTLAVADAAGARRFSYVGISLGGMIGMWLGIHASDRVEKLIVSNTSAKMSATAWSERIAKIRAGGIEAIVDAVLQRWFTQRYLARADASFASTRAAFLAVDPAGYIGCCAAIRDMDLTADLGSIRAPTLVITGTHDVATPKEMGAAIAAAITGAHCVELLSAHIPLPEATGVFAQAVLEFLNGAQPATERERYSVGLSRRREVLGTSYVDARLKQITPFNAEFQDLITRYAWGEMWTRNVLDDRTRRLLVVAMLIAQSRWEEFEMHVSAGLAAELSESELKEVLLLAAIYCGVPAANTGFQRAGAIVGGGKIGNTT